MINSEPTFLLARPLPHVATATRRVVHLFPVPQEIDDKLTALCGETFGRGQLERLNSIAGMPCEPCLARSPQQESS